MNPMLRDDGMTLQKLLVEGKFYDITPYQRKDASLSMEETFPFSGVLRQHYNPAMLFLLVDPLEKHGQIYEFNIADIVRAEELPSLTAPEGVTLERVKIFVKSGSFAMRLQPFIVKK